MSVDPLKFQIILSEKFARQLISQLQEPRQSILLERLDRNPIGLESESPLHGVRWKVTGYRWYPRGMGESGRDATLWPIWA